jgi:predicted RNA-binding protein (virulence factor B family)
MNTFISNVEISVRPREEVTILVSQKLPMGYRVIINNRHWGMIYDNQLFRKIAVGEKLTGYIRKITEDNRIDVSLQKEGFNEVMDSAERLLELVRKNGGRLRLSDDSSPEQVTAATQMSKKVFKRSLGYLLSHKQVRMEGDFIIVEPTDNLKI